MVLQYRFGCENDGAGAVGPEVVGYMYWVGEGARRRVRVRR